MKALIDECKAIRKKLHEVESIVADAGPSAAVAIMFTKAEIESFASALAACNRVHRKTCRQRNEL